MGFRVYRLYRVDMVRRVYWVGFTVGVRALGVLGPGVFSRQPETFNPKKP